MIEYHSHLFNFDIWVVENFGLPCLNTLAIFTDMKACIELFVCEGNDFHLFVICFILHFFHFVFRNIFLKIFCFEKFISEVLFSVLISDVHGYNCSEFKTGYNFGGLGELHL